MFVSIDVTSIFLEKSRCLPVIAAPPTGIVISQPRRYTDPEVINSLREILSETSPRLMENGPAACNLGGSKAGERIPAPHYQLLWTATFISC
jgi:hypothetical protein